MGRWIRRLATLGVLGLPSLMQPSIAGASHCMGCSGPTPLRIELRSASVASDGIVSLTMVSSDRAVPDAWAYTTVSVTDAAGDDVAGSLETYGGFSGAAWRPTMPLTTGQRYRVRTVIDVAAYAEATELMGADRCHEAIDELDFDAVAPGSSPPLSFVAEESFEWRESFALEHLVCCDGSFPAWRFPQLGIVCFDTASQLTDASSCSSLVETGRLSVGFRLADEGPDAADFDIRVLRGDDSHAPSTSDRFVLQRFEAPECVTVEILDLRRSVITESRSCHGDAYADDLGERQRDPTDDLAEMCTMTDPYVCEVEGSQWNPERCRPWPDASDDGGCSCRSDSNRPFAAIGVLGLLALLRRRATRSRRQRR